MLGQLHHYENNLTYHSGFKLAMPTKNVQSKERVEYLYNVNKRIAEYSAKAPREQYVSDLFSGRSLMK